jgi:F420H(2)-dependent quinone reductase
MKRTFRRNLSRRLIDALSTAAIRRGLGPVQRYLLTVRGRRSTAPRTTPVSLVVDGTGRYLVAPNARQAGVVTLSRGAASQDSTVAPVDRAQAARVLRLYLGLEPVTRPYFGVTPDAPDDVMEAEAAHHPGVQAG